MIPNDLIKITEYKGHPIITMKRTKEDKCPFSFGIGKAKLILSNLNYIKGFVDKNEDEI